MPAEEVTPGESILVRSVEVLFLSLPLTWLLGLSQFVWYVLPFMWLVVLLVPPYTMTYLGHWPLVTSVFVFLSAIVLSGFSVVGISTARQITYVWGVLSYTTALGTLVFLGGAAGAESRNVRLMRSVVITMVVANVTGLAALFFGLKGEYVAPFSKLLPAMVRHSDIGTSIFTNSLIRERPTYLFGIPATRVRAFFIYPNTYALANDVAVGMSLYLALRARRQRRHWAAGAYAAAFVLALAAAFASLSRTGILAIVFGGALTLYIHVRRRAPRLSRVVAVLVLACVVAGIYLSYDTLRLILKALVYARGRGSPQSRFGTYLLSAKAVLMHPLGFGTERDVAAGIRAVGLPLGTHSQFVAVLFKYGWLGLAGFGGLLVTVYGSLFRQERVATSSWDGLYFYEAMTWSMAAILFHMLFIELSLDMVSFMMIIVLWSCVVTRTRQYKRQRGAMP